MPKSPSASHLLNNNNNNSNIHGAMTTASNAPGFQQLGGPMSIGATSLMNLPKVNASPSSHLNDRLQQQRAGAPGDLVGTPGGRALPIPPGQSQQQQPQTMMPGSGATLPAIPGTGLTGIGVAPGVGAPGGGGAFPADGGGISHPGLNVRNLPPTPHTSSIPQQQPPQQTTTAAFNNQPLPQINGSLPTGLGPAGVGGNALPGEGGMLPQTGVIPPQQQQQLPFGAPGQIPQQQHSINPPLTLPSSLQQQQQRAGGDSLLLNNRSDSDSDTEWC